LWVDVGGREEAEEMVREMESKGEGECPVDLVKTKRSWGSVVRGREKLSLHDVLEEVIC
jgi:hypothetical protein